LEVKTTRGGINTPFFVSENERRVAAEMGHEFRIYRVFAFENEPKIYQIPGPLEGGASAGADRLQGTRRSVVRLGSFPNL
jgi:hypothetical protein